MSGFSNMDMVTGYVIETLDKALDSHALTHLKQPVQLLLLINTGMFMEW